MPRISTPSIHFLMKNRPNRRGECPVLLVVRFNGRADRATGVSVKPSQWDDVRERVRASHPDAAKLNALLETYRSNLTSASATMIASGDIITPQRLVTFMTNAPKLPAAMTVGDAYAFYTDSHELGVATVQAYHDSLAKFISCCRDVLIADVTVKLCGEWVSSMLRGGIAGSSIHQYFRCFLAAMRYTCKKKDIKLDVEELKEAIEKVPRKRKNRTVVMDEGDVKRMMEWLSVFSDDELVLRSSPRCCMAIFLCSYLLGGVAPTDLSTLRADEFVLNDEYISFSGSRRKTGIGFYSVVPLDELVKKVMGAFFRTASRRDGLLFPMICGGECSKVDVSDKTQVHKAVDRWTSVFGLKFKKAVEELNGTLEDEEKVPVGMTMYSARHSYATNFLRTSGNIAALASMLGRSPSTIATYIATLTKEESLLTERLKMTL